MDVEEIKTELEKAMTTLRWLPACEGSLIGRVKAIWPETLNSEQEDWWSYASESARYNRIPPTPADIDRLDRVLGWLWPLSEEERIVLCGRASGLSWRGIMRARRRIGRKPGSHETHRQLWRSSIRKIARMPSVAAA